MKVDPFDMFSFGAIERMNKFSAGALIAINNSSRYTEDGKRYARRFYCEIRYRDHVWCGVSILNPTDEYNEYKGVMLAVTRAARAVAHEMNFPVNDYVAELRLKLHLSALETGHIQPTAWEKEHYNLNAEGATK